MELLAIKLKHMRYIVLLLIIPFLATGQDPDWRNGLYIFDEFTAPVSTTSGSNFYAITSSGSVGIHESITISDFGLAQLSTGSSSTGAAAIVTNNRVVRLGGGPASFEIKIDSLNALSDATQGYALLVGLFASATSATQTKGVFFLYDSLGVSTGSASSDRWQTVVADGSVRNYYETSVDVSVRGAKLRAEIDSDGTGVDFYIDDVSVRTETATGPTCATCQMAFGVFIIKSVGTTARWVLVDYAELDYKAPK